jgi:hypothetical protein
MHNEPTAPGRARPGRVEGASSSRVLPTNALPCVCFWAFAANAAVSATGTAAGKKSVVA